MENNYKKVYLNEAQLDLWNMRPNSKCIIGSRRFGKATCIGMDVATTVNGMPKSRNALVVRTFGLGLMNTIPAMKEGLERFGYLKDVHYTVGRKAPKYLGFEMPYFEPDKWDSAIHFFNGTVFSMLSDEVKYAANSCTFDSMIADECKTLNRNKMVNETIPAISGYHAFKDSPWFCGKHLYSDLPTHKSGLWMLEEEKKMNSELIEFIRGLVLELALLKKNDTGSFYFKKQIEAKISELNYYRAQAYYFGIYNILDNIHVVGEKYIKDQYRDLSPFVFRTALLSQIVRKVDGGFYASLDEKLHYYDAVDNAYLDSLRGGDGDIDLSKYVNLDCRKDADLNPNMPLCIAFDTNININWLIVGQPDYDKGILRTVNSFFVKQQEGNLVDVCKKFAKYYRYFANNDVVFYYDHTFLQGKSGTNDETYYQTIYRVLTDEGYNVIPVYIGKAMFHSEKHLIIDQALKGQFTPDKVYLRPTFNRSNNEDLITAMEQTGTTISPTGWGKDKSGEKAADDPLQNPVEHRTDGTDAWDTLFIGCNLYPCNSSYSSSFRNEY